MSIPRISVVVPLYNKEDEIERCLRSILAQTVAEFEVVVIDDGSTDQGPSRVLEVSDPRIRLIRQRNGGLADARNRGMAESRADWIAFLDADDQWRPEHLGQILALVEAHPSAGLAFTAFWIDRGSRMRRRVQLSGRYRDRSGRIRNYFSIPSGKTLPSACAVRKDAALEVGGFRQMFGEDIDFFLRMAARWQVVYGGVATSVWHIDAKNRMCVDQSKSVKMHEMGSLGQSVQYVAARPDVSQETKTAVRRYVAHRERNAVLDSILKGQRDHARILMRNWESSYGSLDSRLRVLSILPTGVLRILKKVRELGQKSENLVGYALDWRSSQAQFRS